MAHVLIAGMTMSGKTTLATRLAHQYKVRGVEPIILDPMRDPRWPSEYLFTDSRQFLELCAKSTHCALFLDESGDTIGRYNDEMFWLATKARHYGHRSHFICQRPSQLSPTVRTQCSYMYLFNVGISDAKILADEWGKPELREANTLGRGEYFAVERFGPLQRSKI